MKRISLFLLFTIGWQQLVWAQPEGRWQGDLQVEVMTLPLIFDVKKTDQQYEALMESPLQAPYPFKAQTVIWDSPTLTLQFPSFEAAFYGDIVGDTLHGQWVQAGHSIPLTMVRQKEGAEKPLVEKKVQTPEPPFTYTVKEVRFKNQQAGITLAGTLTLPEGKGPFPAVVLVSGSGPQDRDETILDHKPFWVIAHAFTQAGYAVLRYDDRGFGASEGKFRGATTADFAEDAQAALDYLRQQKEINPQKTGLLGHSEGGLIGWMLSAGKNKPNFLISLAGPGIAIDELMVLQTEAILVASGANPTQIQQATATNRALYQLVKTSTDSSETAKALYAKLAEAYGGKPDKAQKKTLENQIRQLLDPWYRFFIQQDPRPYLRAIDIPVYAANGSRDVQVTANENLRSILDLIDYQKSPQTRVQNYYGLNHLFQSCISCLPQEYGELRETISPQVLADIIAWMDNLK